MAEGSTFTPSIYSCGICESKLYNPKVLKCFHVFCRRCLDKQSFCLPKYRIACPLCESLTSLNREGIDGLDDYKFSYRSENDQSRIQCQMCDNTGVVSSECEDCQELMCKECHDYHKKHNKFKGHTVVLIDTQGNGTVSKDDACMQVATVEKMCQEHYTYCRPIEEFCKSCSKPVCSICMLGIHKGHKTEPFQTTVAKARTSLSVALRGLKSRLPLLQSLLNEAAHEEKKYNNHIKNTRVEIKDLSERLKLDVCRKIDEITDENICKLDSLAHTDKAVLESYRKDVNRSKKTIDGLLYATENLLEFGDKSDLIKSFPELETRLCHYEHNYGITMPDIFEPLLKPGSIKLNQLYEAVGQIEREQRPMTNSFIAVKQKPSSHLVDNENAFAKRKSFNLDFRVDSVVCTYNTDAVLVLVGNQLKIISADGSYKDFVFIQCGKCHVNPVGHTQNNVYFYLTEKNTLCLFRLSQISKQIEKLDVKVTFTHACTVDNDTVLLLNQPKGTFYETDNNGRVINTFGSKLLAQNFNGLESISCMRVTTVSRILICTEKSLYAFTFSGKLEQLFQDENSYFWLVCEDQRGNVFVADRAHGNQRICLFTPYGHYIGDILPPNAHNATTILLDLAIDRCGNLWTFSGSKALVPFPGKSEINIYSYT
ncbi:tripartite motif-containing protein 45-like [Mytilus californianus]|uniref:tripartite motif-containing protein 45-like n=1 Tax=Mytilus californianus TaxID=6549 RepID=UPI002247545F|nr:tripartite motif-containing protein 45-like [Mytilus californianus]